MKNIRVIIVTLMVTLFTVSTASADWYNPFTWGNNNPNNTEMTTKSKHGYGLAETNMDGQRQIPNININQTATDESSNTYAITTIDGKAPHNINQSATNQSHNKLRDTEVSKSGIYMGIDKDGNRLVMDGDGRNKLDIGKDTLSASGARRTATAEIKTTPDGTSVTVIANEGSGDVHPFNSPYMGPRRKGDSKDNNSKNTAANNDWTNGNGDNDSNDGFINDGYTSDLGGIVCGDVWVTKKKIKLQLSPSDLDKNDYLTRSQEEFEIPFPPSSRFYNARTPRANLDYRLLQWCTDEEEWLALGEKDRRSLKDPRTYLGERDGLRYFQSYVKAVDVEEYFMKEQACEAMVPITQEFALSRGINPNFEKISKNGKEMAQLIPWESLTVTTNDDGNPTVITAPDPNEELPNFEMANGNLPVDPGTPPAVPEKPIIKDHDHDGS